MNEEFGGRIHLVMVQTRGSVEQGRELLNEAKIPLSTAVRTRQLHGPFRVTATPTTILVDADGVVVRRIVGAKGHRYFANELNQLLK
ncbi:MAG: TlpA family protein disulfide reductase [Myxococcales bacterium]